ncbi:MAG: hypothetical protein JSR80_07645 [Verrucomicrobia bacterium]|nr:hypothetical protein [Verrucomicrobiota bacterium]
MKWDQVVAGKPQYEEGRRLYTAEINAAWRNPISTSVFCAELSTAAEREAKESKEARREVVAIFS